MLEMSEDEAACDVECSEYEQETDYEQEMHEEFAPDTVTGRPPVHVLPQAKIEQLKQHVVHEMADLLCITEEDALRVLRKFKWDRQRAQDAWYTDMEAVKASVGLQDQPHVQPPQEAMCQVCFDTFATSKMHCAACQHYFCSDCWRGFISTAISEGPSVLDLRCPIPKCGACVPSRIVRAAVDDTDWAKYQAYTMRSFVEDSKHMSWCVGPSCATAMECLVDLSPDEPLDVRCSECDTAFCFTCKEDAHRPVACQYVRQWVLKNSAESESVQWIFANTKPCPNCRKPIEKNQGCMHMTCSQCRHEFCWLCLGNWRQHGSDTGGNFACNRFESAKAKGEYDEETRRREAAKQSLDRYLHYFERWNAHRKARSKARTDTKTSVDTFMKTLADQTSIPSTQLKFILDAWDQIMECRRILSWTYTYAYYQYDPEGPLAKEDNFEASKTFFEFRQGDAEAALERLHEVAEAKLKAITRPMPGYIHPKPPTPDHLATYQKFREELVRLTQVTRKFFDELVEQLEMGLAHLPARRYASLQAA